MESIRYELKYCEGCGTLKLRPLNSESDDCAVCERMLARFRFPRAVVAKKYSKSASAVMLRNVPLVGCCAMPVGRPQ